MHRTWILVEGARFPPFGFETTEISSNSIENTSLQRKNFFHQQPNSTPTQPNLVTTLGADLVTTLGRWTSGCLGGNREAKSIYVHSSLKGGMGIYVVSNLSGFWYALSIRGGLATSREESFLCPHIGDDLLHPSVSTG